MSNKPNRSVATMGIEIGKNSFHVGGLDQRARSCCAEVVTQPDRSAARRNVVARLIKRL